jgi:hypothetical protein
MIVVITIVICFFDLLCFLSLWLVITVVYGSSPIHKATLFYPLVM